MTVDSLRANGTNGSALGIDVVLFCGSHNKGAALFFSAGSRSKSGIGFSALVVSTCGSVTLLAVRGAEFDCVYAGA